MKTQELTQAFANLEQVETTSARNGYPRNLQHAYIGFESFAQAQEIANEFNLQLIWLTARDGQQLWTRSDLAYRTLEITSDLFGDDYDFVSDMDDFREHISEDISQIGDELTSEMLLDFAKILKEMEEEADNLEDDEVLVTYCGRYYRTQKLHPIEFSYDGRKTVLGAIDLDEE